MTSRGASVAAETCNRTIAVTWRPLGPAGLWGAAACLTWALSLSSAALAADALQTPGTIEAVTVYRGQALVTRTLPVTGAAGLREVLVTELPECIVPGSLHAEGTGGVDVRSVTYRVDPVAGDVREEVRKLDEQIRALGDQLKAAQRSLTDLTQRAEYLNRLENFTSATATGDMSHGVLDANSLVTVSNYTFESRQKLAADQLKAEQATRDLQEQTNLVQRQRAELTGGSSRVRRAAAVFVNAGAADGGAVRVSYVVNNATWSPSYTARRDDERKQVRLEYNAAIQQRTGEAWNNVRMTLSTATPTLTSAPPSLAPLWVTLAPPAAPGATGGTAQPASTPAPGGYNAAVRQLKNEQVLAENTRQRGSNDAFAQTQQFGTLEAPNAQQREAPVDLERELNRLADELQVLDLTFADKSDLRRGAREAVADEGLSVTYELATATSLPSRSDQQLVQIAALDLTAEFYKVAMPVLTAYVYEEASAKNTSPHVLLAGPVSSYASGQFVGRANLPTVSSGQSFTVGFGIDSSLHTTRELADKTESVQGGNRVVELQYEIAVENYSSAAVPVRILDRLPRTRGADVRVTLSDGAPELSTDATYLGMQRPQGLLRWDMQVPAGATGPGRFTLTYKYKLEYDKGLQIRGLAVAATTR